MDKIKKNWQLIVLISIIVFCLILLFSSNKSETIVARAAMMQGVASIALLYVTWVSIGRSDEQIRISNEIVGLEYRHHLVVTIDVPGENVYLTNLSKLPILISSIRYEIVAHRIINTSLGENIVIGPGEIRNIKLDGIYLPDSPDDDLTFNPNFDLEGFQKKLDDQWQKRYISFSYLYAGTGQQVYAKLFEIRPEAVPWRSEEPVTWRAVLVPLKDYDTPMDDQPA